MIPDPTEYEWINFPFKSFIDADPYIANWIIAIAQIGNDIQSANNPLLELIGEPYHPAPEVTYYLTLLCSHIREASKFYEATTSDTKIYEYIKSQDAEIFQRFESILTSFNPWKNSFVQQVIKTLRDIFFHYPSHDEIEDSGVLNVLSSSFGEIRMKGNGFGNTRFVFADDFRINQQDHIITSAGYTFDAVIDKIAELAVDHIEFSHAIVMEFILSLPDEAIVPGMRDTK